MFVTKKVTRMKGIKNKMTDWNEITMYYSPTTTLRNSSILVTKRNSYFKYQQSDRVIDVGSTSIGYESLKLF